MSVAFLKQDQFLFFSDSKLLDLSQTSPSGKNLLHYLIENNDYTNFLVTHIFSFLSFLQRTIVFFQSVLDRCDVDLDPAAANAPHPDSGETPMSLCMRLDESGLFLQVQNVPL